MRFLRLWLCFTLFLSIPLSASDYATGHIVDKKIDTLEMSDGPDTQALEDKVEHSYIYQKIAKENLKSLSDIESGEDDNGLCSVINDIEDLGLRAVLMAKLQSQLNPSSQAKRRLIFTLLSEHEQVGLQPQSSVLDETTWQDLELLCGPKSNPSFYLASLIDRAVTETGRVTMYKKLVQPKDRIKQLIDQQAIVRELVKNKKLFNELDAKLKQLETPENVVLSFWDEEDIFKLIVVQNKIKLPFEEKLKVLRKISTWLNKSAVLLETWDKLEYLFGIAQSGLSAYAAAILPVYAFTGKSILPGISPEELNKFSVLSTIGLISLAINKFCPNPFARGGTSLLATYVHADSLYKVPRHFMEDNAVRECLQTKLMYVATYINNIKEMVATAAKNPVLSKKLPILKNFETMLKNLEQKSKDVKLLLDSLKTDTFKGEPSFFSYFGRIFTTYLLMIELREYFVEAMLAVGELDAQLSIAKLYNEFEKKKVAFCFPKYLKGDKAKLPAIKAIDFWNPFIDPEKVVPNSLLIGHRYGEPQNAIITGPNAGGKSTVTKALIISIILAQSFGIAPAKALTFTPFTKITTYLNITDDIAQGNSHFEAGVLRAREVLDITDGLQKGELGFTAVDEIFQGTTFKEGQAAAYSFIDQLGKNKRSICITNTHFPLIPTLEKTTGNFSNYKVTVVEKPGEKIQYPFTLEPGISDQVVTLKILKEEGFGDEFIDQAQQILDEWAGY